MTVTKSASIHYLLLALTLVMGGALRFAYVIYLPGQGRDLLHSDMQIYDLSGKAMAEGQPVTGRIGLYGYHPLSANLYNNAGYIWIVAAHYKLAGAENAHLALRLSQAAVSTLTLLIVYLIGRMIFGRTAGLIAMFLLAVHLPQAYYAGLILTETWFTFLQTVFLYGCLLTFESVANGDENPPPTQLSVRWPTIVLALLSGIAGGFACAVRESMVPSLVLMILLALVRPPLMGSVKGRWKLALALLAGSMVVIAPITVRNYSILGRFVLLSTNGPATFSTSHVHHEITWDATAKTVSNEQMEEVHRQESMQYLREHWSDYLLEAPEFISQIWLSSDFWPHVTKVWKYEEFLDKGRDSRALLMIDEPQGRQFPSISYFPDVLRYNDQIVWLMIGLPGALFSLFLLPSKRRTHRLILLSIATYLLIPLVAAWFPRYRVPAAPMIFLLAGQTLATIGAFRRQLLAASRG